MRTPSDKSEKNKSQPVANEFIQKQDTGDSAIQFIDNRTEAAAQRKLQDMANKGSQVSRLSAFQEMANDTAAPQQELIQKKEKKTGQNLNGNLKATEAINSMVSATANISMSSSPIQLMQTPIDRLAPIEEELLRSGLYSKADLWELSISEKINAFKSIVEPDEKKFLVDYLVRRGLISTEEAELKDIPALLIIYKANTVAEDRTGLATEESTKIMASRTKLNAGKWQDAAPDERMNILVIRARTELRAYGVPVVKHDTKTLPPGEHANFDHTHWTIHFNAETFDSSNDAYATMSLPEVANTVYHECRHAEQHYRAACLLAGDGLSFGEIVARTKISVDVAKEAVKHPIEREHADNLHVAEAIEWEGSFSGGGKEYREGTILAYKDVKLRIGQLWQKAEELKMVKLTKIYDFRNIKSKMKQFKELDQELSQLQICLEQWPIIDGLDITPQEKSNKLIPLMPVISFDAGEEEALELDLGLDEQDETFEDIPYSAEDWASELAFLKESFATANSKFQGLKKFFQQNPYIKVAQAAMAAAKRAEEAVIAIDQQIEGLEAKRAALHERYENLPEERDAFAVGNELEATIQRQQLSDASPTNTDSSVIQRAIVDGVATADTDLIKIKGKTIYGGEFSKRAIRGNAVQIDDQKKYRSRRGTIFSEEDRDKPRTHRWYLALELRDETMEDGVYFPDELFMEDDSSESSSDSSVELDMHLEMMLERMGMDVDEMSESLKSTIEDVITGHDTAKIARAVFSSVPEALQSVYEPLHSAIKMAESDKRGFCQALSRFALAAEQFTPVVEDESDLLGDTAPPINEVEIDSLYKHIMSKILAAKGTAKSAGKPLLVLVGDQHYTKSSGFPEYLILDIIQRLGISNVVLEITPSEAVNVAISLESEPEPDISGNKAYLDAWFRQIVGGGSKIIPGELNKEEVAKRLGTTSSEEAVEARNTGISIALQKLGSSALMVVGSSHLMGLMRDPAIREMYALCVFNTLDPKDMVFLDSIRGTGEIRKSTQYLLDVGGVVDTIILTGSVDHLSPEQMGDLARAAGRRMK